MSTSAQAEVLKYAVINISSILFTSKMELQSAYQGTSGRKTIVISLYGVSRMLLNLGLIYKILVVSQKP